MTIGNFVWLDRNGNGVQDSGEPGIPGVTLTLTGTDASDAAVTDHATTASDGSYQFTEMPGTYTVTVDASNTTGNGALASYRPTATGMGTTETDSDVNPSGTTPAALASAASDLNLDFGYTPTFSLGNRVFADNGAGAGTGGVPNDGIRNGDEPGIAGVSVALFAYGGTSKLQSIVTDSDGFYRFDGLDAGTYVVVVDVASSGDVLAGMISSAGASTDLTLAGDSRDHGLDTPLSIGSVVNGIASGPVTLGLGLQPTGEATAGTGAGTNGPTGDVADQLVVDFGFTLQRCPDRWSDWVAEWGIGETDLTGNPDDDRYNNLIEYAFCLPPNSGALKPFCLVPGIDSTIDGVYRRTVGGAQDVTYSLEYSPSLTPTTWTAIPIMIGTGIDANATVTNNRDGTEYVRISNLEKLTTLTGGQGFVRMRVDPITGETGELPAFAEVLGWTETLLEGDCYKTYNTLYLRCSSFTGKVDTPDGVSGQTLNFAKSAGTVSIASLLKPGDAYYLEVTSPGANEGQRFDVVSADVNSVTVAAASPLSDGSPPFNTLAGLPPTSLAGASVVLRRHWTLGEMFPVANFYADIDSNVADRVEILAAGGYTAYFLWSNNGGSPLWVKDGDVLFADQSATVIPPGQGMFVLKRNAGITLFSYGEVRANKFIRPLYVGDNLVGGGYPINQSATGTGSRQMNLAFGFYAAGGSRTSDIFAIWNGDAVLNATGYSTYYFLTYPARAILNWVKVSDLGLAPQDVTILMLRDRRSWSR